MSRAQQGQVLKTAQGENTAYNANAQTGFNTTNQDINKLGAATNKFIAGNPYQQGGQAQTLENQQLSDTAAGQAQAGGQALQSQAVRTGQNAGGAIAATEQMQQQNTRNLSGDEAKANAERIGAGADYNKGVLGATEVPAQMEASLASGSAGAGNSALDTAQKANEQPGFWDEFGNSFAQSLGQTAGGGNFKVNMNI